MHLPPDSSVCVEPPELAEQIAFFESRAFHRPAEGRRFSLRPAGRRRTARSGPVICALFQFTRSCYIGLIGQGWGDKVDRVALLCAVSAAPFRLLKRPSHRIAVITTSLCVALSAGAAMFSARAQDGPAQSAPVKIAIIS